MKIGIIVSRSSVVLCLLLLAAAAVFTAPAAAEVTPNALTVWGNTAYGISPVPAGTDYVAVSAGGYHNIALKSDGSLVAWGANNDGECDVPAGTDFTAADAGAYHSVALKSDGSLVAWGFNGNGQTDAPVGNDFVAVTAGAFHNVALKSDGSLFAWGYNGFQECDFPTGNDFTAVSAGGFHSVALKTDGSLVAWGNDEWGQCDVPAGNDFVAISAGLYHNVALKSDGSLVAWGDNYYGECDVPAGNDFVCADAGGIHSVALKSDGSVALWGSNDVGQCSPAFADGYSAAAAGYYHTTAIAPPLTVTSVTPDAGVNNGPIDVTITGSRFAPNAVPRLIHRWESDGESFEMTVDAVNVVVEDSTRITCTFDLTGLAPGWYAGVAVRNPDGQYAERVDAITVRSPPPIVTSISPNSGRNNASVDVTVIGEGFTAPYVYVSLKRYGHPTVNGTSVNVKSETEVQCTLNISGAVTGPWDVCVRNMASSDTILPNGFTVLQAPPTVTVDQKSSQPDPTSQTPVYFTVVFSRPVTDFDSTDVTLSGTAGATTAVVTGSGPEYTVAVSGMTRSGSVKVTIPEAVAHDEEGLANYASTSTDNEVTFQAQEPTVTINQQSGQRDPTTASPINFTVVFSRAVTGFETGDVDLSGTAGATTAVVGGSGTTYTVTVSGMACTGTVTATIPEGVAQDSNGISNVASTSADNTVTFQIRPVCVSISPKGPVPAGPTTFTSRYSEAGGYNQLKLVRVMFNKSQYLSGSLSITYDIGTNHINLCNDSGGFVGAGYSLGDDVVLENSQGYLYVKDTTVSGEGNVLTVNWRVQFKDAFAALNIKSYMYAQNLGGVVGGWSEMGLHYNALPSASIHPNSGLLPIDTQTTLTCGYGDANGYLNLRKCYVLVNNSLAQTDGMFLLYDNETNRVYLKNDANTSWGTGYAPGTDVVLSNSQCDVYVKDTQVTVDGAFMSIYVFWSIKLKEPMASKSLMGYMYVSDGYGGHTGWKKYGTYFIPVAPTCVSVTPSTGYVQTGTPQVFTTQYSDPNCFANLYQMYMQISQTSSQVNAILVKYDAQLNKVYLKDDANTTWGTGYTPGTNVILENTQCILNVKDTQIVPSGANDLMIDWNIELKPTQIGKLLCERMYAKDNESLNSAWKVKGYIREQ